jgi:hypothetical protein
MSFYDSLFEISTPLLFVLSIVAMCMLSAAVTLGVLGMQRIWPSRKGVNMSATTLTGFILPASLMIAFISSEVWTEAGKAAATTEREAIAVAESLRLSSLLPETEGEKLRTALLDYSRSVVEDDWKELDRRSFSPRTDDAFQHVRSVFYAIRADERGANPTLLEALRTQINAIAEAKETRRLIATHSVSAIKWIMLMVQLAATSWVIAELHRESRRELVTALITFSFSFGAICFLILMYDRPFAGVTYIEPAHLMRILSTADAVR